MSFQAMAWAVKQKTGDGLARCLLLTLANYANEKDECWPSLSRLAADCEMNKVTVIRKLAQLVERGLIAKEQPENPAGTYNVYRLLTVTPSCTEQPPSCTEQPGVVAQSNPILSIEPIKEPRQTPRAVLSEVLKPETVDALIEHRAAKKAKLTTAAAKILVKQFLAYGDPERAVEEMLARGWTGFKSEWAKPAPVAPTRVSSLPLPTWRPNRGTG